MSSRSVNIIGGDSVQDRQQVAVDSWDNALVTEDSAHANIHRGIMFSASTAGDIPADGMLDWLLRVPAGQSVHIEFFGTVEHSMRGFLYEAPITTDNGTAIFCNNRNRFSSLTATLLIFAGPTVTDDGLLLMDYFMPGGSKTTASGGEGSSEDEWIFSPGDYLLRISNTVIGPAAIGYAGLLIDFYEPAQNPETE